MKRSILLLAIAGLGLTVPALGQVAHSVLRVGDAVDLDFDGQVEPSHVLSEIRSAQMGELFLGFVIGRVDTNGTPSMADDLDSLLQVSGTWSTYGIGKLNSALSRSVLDGRGEASLGANDFSLQLSFLVPNRPGLGFWSLGQALIPLLNHFLYLQPPVNRILPSQVSDPLGKVTVPVPIDATMVGTLRYFQYWSRDPDHPDGTNVELSNGLVVSFVP